MKHNAQIMLLALALAPALACGGGGSTGGLDAEASYTFTLSSSAEVPAPKPTTASGAAQIILYPNSIDYQVSATSIIGITMAHIHSGAPGVAGPILVTLFLPGAATGTVNGVFATGSITQANLAAGVTLESVKSQILSGNTYVNVHTVANPSGELRGQIR